LRGPEGRLPAGDPERDLILGSGRSDYFESGDKGNDIIYGFGGEDSVDYGNETGDRGIVAILPSGTVRDIHGDVDTIDSIENVYGTDKSDVIIGDQKDNVLNGRSGGDTIYGLGGDDTISVGTAGTEANQFDMNIANGGAGEDLIFSGFGNNFLTGGAGADIFAPQEDKGRDLITDFEQGVDRVVVYRPFASLEFSSYSTVDGTGTQFYVGDYDFLARALLSPNWTSLSQDYRSFNRYILHRKINNYSALLLTNPATHDDSGNETVWRR